MGTKLELLQKTDQWKLQQEGTEEEIVSNIAEKRSKEEETTTKIQRNLHKLKHISISYTMKEFLQFLVDLPKILIADIVGHSKYI